MKKILLMFIASCLTTIAFAQKLSPVIKEGTMINSTAFVSGQEFPLMMTVKTIANPFSLAWSVDGYGDGTFEMSDKALESATKMTSPTQPTLGVTKLGDDETFGLISRAAYKALVDGKTFTYSGMVFKIKTPASAPMKMGDKEVDVTHVVSENGKLELWILNNASFPLIVQSSGMPTDILVNDIK